MNAVNLIPSDSRRRRGTPSTSRPTLALIGGLVVALVVAVLYVSAVNDVTTRKSELARVTANAAVWRAAANSYASFVQASRQRAQQLADVRQLAAGRFPWSQLLSQIGGLMPAKAALSTLQATTTPGASAAVPPQPTVQLSGCAASQSTVAQTMVQLHSVRGVSAVSLSSSTDSGAAAAPSGPAPSAAGQNGSCPFPVQFQVSMTFGTSAATAAGSSSGVSTGSASPASSGAATTAAATSPTGAVAQ